MSTAYEAVADSRPRLRHDVLYTRTEDGVLLHNAHSGFRLTSPTAYRLVSLLVPHFNGRNRVADICQRLPEAQRAMIGELVRALYDREFARDVPEPESDPSTVLGEAVAKHFAAQIAYVDHYVGGAPQRFAAFRETPVAVVGSDAIARACAGGLVRNGAAAITVTPQVAEAIAGDLVDAATADCPVAVTLMADEPDWAALGDNAIVIVAGDDAPRICVQLLTQGIPAGKRLLPAWTAGPRLVVGPSQGEGHDGCWCCAMLRWADNDDSGAAARVWQAAALPPGSRVAGERPEAPLQAMAGNLLAYEVFRLTTAALPAETDGSVIVQHMASLDVLVEPLLPHPLCAFCAVRADPLDLDGLELDPAPAAEQPDETAEAEQAVARLNSHQPLISPHVGLVRRYDDEHWDQTPVKVGTVELTAGGRRRTVSAFDIHHVAGARLRALRTAAVVATGHAAVTAVPQDDANRYGAKELGLASGWTDAAPTAWAGARSLRTGAHVAVPLAVVEPFGPANADRSVEPTAAGGGAGADAAEAIRAGLASALGYAALRRAVDGAAVQRVRLDTLGTAPELVFLTKSAANLGIAVDLLDLGGPVPVLLARSWDVERQRWWYALHADPAWGTAAAAALRDVVGQVQIHRQGGEAAVDTGDPVLIDFDPGSLPLYAEADGRPGQVARWSDVLADNGFDVLVAPVSGADLRRGGLVAVRVLLSGVDGR